MDTWLEGCTGAGEGAERTQVPSTATLGAVVRSAEVSAQATRERTERRLHNDLAGRMGRLGVACLMALDGHPSTKGEAGCWS